MPRSKSGFNTVESARRPHGVRWGLLGVVTTTALTGRLLVEGRNRTHAPARRSIRRPAAVTLWATVNLGKPLDSSSPCFGFFPIIGVSSGSRIEGGRGQGVLLADGDLELADGFDFYGVVVVAGRLTIAGAGTRVTGLVLLRHSPSDTARLTGVGSVALSRCAIRRAAGRSTPLRPLSGRSWSRF